MYESWSSMLIKIDTRFLASVHVCVSVCVSVCVQCAGCLYKLKYVHSLPQMNTIVRKQNCTTC